MRATHGTVCTRTNDLANQTAHNLMRLNHIKLIHYLEPWDAQDMHIYAEVAGHFAQKSH